jgi:ATP-binding cassette subfamily B protein
MENQIRLGHSRGLTHALTHAANDFTFVVILVIGGFAMIDRTLPAGDLFKFVDLTFKVFWPIIAVGWILGMYPRAVASAKRVDELLDRTSDIREPAAPAALPVVRGALALRGVGFTYEDADRPAVSGVTVDVPAGTVLGVVGPTGSGKTTLLLLLGRLFDATEGDIRLDGVPIKDLPIATLRDALGYVPQDSFLFSEPYKENIAFGADEPVSDERIRELVGRSA